MFKEGEKYMPNSSTFLYNFGILYIRKNEYQKAIDLFERVINNNPNHAGSHYLLGSLAFENGKIIEGTLAMMTYLILAPTGQYANQAVMHLNANYGQDYLAENKVVFTKSGDNFEDIETILRNQLPLKKVYKIKSTIDDKITRQVQAVAEYALEHKMGDGFFETTYIPWVKDMVEKNQFEGYTYFSLLCMEDKIGKELNKQKKKILAFRDDYVAKDFWTVFGKRKQDLFGKTEEVMVSIREQKPFIVGVQVNGEFDGKCKYLNAYENIAGELNFKNGELDGLQKYYDEKGRLTEQKFFVNGKLTGNRTSYYENGGINVSETYKDDVLDGISTSYYPNGGKNCEINFTNGERNGTLVCLYEAGTKKSEIDFSKGKLSGKYNAYNELGILTGSYNCVDDKVEGNYLEYYDDGKLLKSEAVYKNGEVQGAFKNYYVNKGLEKENIYTAGKITKSTEYHENGEKISESFYTDKGDLDSYSYFNSDGVKYFEEKYKSGELKSWLQYTADSPKPTETSLSKKNFELKNLNGTLKIKGAFDKGKKIGEWDYFYNNGLERLKEAYNTQGKVTGIVKNYALNGNVANITNYTNDTISGVYEIYSKNRLSQIFNYEKGEQSGPFKTFYSNGALSTEGIIKNGDVTDDKYTYFQNGNISIIDHYIDGFLTYRKTFTLKGKLENEIDYKNKTGKFTYSFNDGVYTKIYETKNGILNGKYIAKDKLNTVITDAEYLNGLLHNVYKEYSPLGTVLTERNYYCGKINGMSKIYDYNGVLRYTEEHLFDVEQGKTIRYYHNKLKLSEYSQQNGSNEGETIYYNQKEEPILKVGFKGNQAVYYIRKNKTGELNDKVIIENQTAQIASLYPNGKTAIQYNLNKGSNDGKFVINNIEGKPEFECAYKSNLLDGIRTEYYANGKIYKKESFSNNEYDGLQEYFKEDGKPWIVVNLKNDELHGDTMIYEAGKLVVTKKYDSDELVEIIK
jgi:antitoxin component YwqK of YwqJK toxin-antitoxin module